MIKLLRLLLPVILLLVAGPIRAASEGQEDLDKATDAKLNAKTIIDLSEVIRLSESALEKGLDEGNTRFAKKLLVSTLFQRAQETVQQLRTSVRSVADLNQKRQFAVSDLEKAIKLDPKQPEAYLLIAQLSLISGGETKKAREAIDKALDLGLDEPATRAKALQLRAHIEEQPDKRLADLDEAVRLMPDDADLVRERGLLLGDMDKLDRSLAALNKAIELEPNDGPTYEAKAIVLDRLKKYDEALSALDKARQLSPDSAMPLLQRARIHLQKGEKDKAMADVDQALKLKPELPAALRTRAVLLTDRQRYDEALGALEKLHKLAPKDRLTLLQLAMLYSEQKKTNKAIENYTALLAEDPEEWRALRGRGDVYLNLGKHTEAIADYEKAIKLEPKDDGILNNFAWVLATSPDDKLRDGKRAVELATRAAEVTEHKVAYILSTLAAAYAESGDFDTAIKWSAKAVEIGDKQHDDSLKKELESYKAKKPWRERFSEEKPAEKEGPAEKEEPSKKTP